MSWVLLVVAGLLEVVWASLLPSTKGFSRLVPSVLFVAALSASMFLLATAARHLPLGTAYAVWVGIGAVGTAVVGIVAHGDPTTFGRVGFLALLVVSIVGLRLTSGS